MKILEKSSKAPKGQQRNEGRKEGRKQRAEQRKESIKGRNKGINPMKPEMHSPYKPALIQKKKVAPKRKINRLR